MDATEFIKSMDQKQDYDPSYPHSLSVRSASRASAGRASQISIPHALHIPPNNEPVPSAPPTPSAKSMTGSRAGDKWTDHTTAMPSSASAHELETDPPRSTSKNPPFIPSDYTKARGRPWEGEDRKQAYHNISAEEAEAKYREMEEAINAANRNGQSNSVKARRFGRSVVNLLRQKSNHAPPDNHNRYEPPHT